MDSIMTNAYQNLAVSIVRWYQQIPYIFGMLS